MHWLNSAQLIACPKHTKRSHNLARSTQLKRYGRYSLSQFGTVASAGGHRVPANAPFQRRNRCLHLLTVAGERAFEICLQSPRTLLFQLSRKATIGFTLAARRAGRELAKSTTTMRINGTA